MKTRVSSKLITCFTIGIFSMNALLAQEFKEVVKQKIINGSDVLIEDHPYQVDLGGCGGAVLSATWIVTAEHCINGDGSTMTIRAGYTRRSQSQSAQTVRVKRAIRNPNIDSDMSLLELETPLDLSGDLVKPIAYASPEVFSQGLVALDAMCMATGWGLTDPNNGGSAPDHLKGALLKFGKVALSDDRIRVEEYEERMVCRGDSGGPLVVESLDKSQYILVGTVSGGEGEPCSDYGFWGNIAKASAWIEAETGIKPYSASATLSNQDFASATEKVTLSPIPANEVISINAKSTIEEVKIFTLSGQKVLTAKGTNDINVSTLSNGTYILQDNNGSLNKLFVIKK